MDRFKFRAWFKTAKNMSEVVSWNMREYFDNHSEASEWILMQCTGLKDKNGKLIFEGDIVKEDAIMGDPTTYVVCWHISAFKCFYPNDYFEHDNPVDVLNWWIDSRPVEVIGNIYENPELLK